MPEKKSIRILFFVAVIISLWNYFSGLPIDVTRDAGKYATISKEIYQNGNYINLTVHGDAYDQKPPMLFWLGAIGFKIGGVSNFWFKLPILLLVFAGFYWSYKLGESLYNKRVGILTAVLLFFSFIYVLYTMDVHTDTPLQAFVTLALWQLFEFIKTKQNKHWITGFLAIGLAMLSKGPIGAAIPAFAVLGHLIFTKNFRFLGDYRWYLGIILSLIVISPALTGLFNQFGWKGIQFFFWDNNVGRITGTYVKANNDPLFYVHNLIYLFLPWSLLFFIAVFYEFRTLVKNKFRSNEYFTLTGIWIFFIILNSASSQLPNYIFSIVPLIAVLTAKWINMAIRQRSRLTTVFNFLQYFVTVLIWFLIIIIAIYLFPLRYWFYWVLLLVFAGLELYVFLNTRERLSKLIMPSVIAFVFMVFLLNNHVFPYMFSLQAPPEAARYFTEHAGENDILYNYRYDQYELFFYSEPQAIQLDSFKEIEKTADRDGNWIFTNPLGLKDITTLKIKPDTIIEYQHLYLNRGAKFINPATRDSVLKPLYLIKF